jgi:hypothetical protein
MSKLKNTFHIRLIRHLREWHRKLGIITAFFIIFLALSGIVINHANTLTIDSKHVNNELLLNFYGIKQPTDVRYYDNKLIITNEFVWLKDKLLLESNESIISAARFQQYWLVATAEQLYLFSSQGELVDQLDSASGLPSNISAMSITNDTVILKSSAGYFQSDNEFFDWQAITPTKALTWVQATQTTDEQNQLAILQYKSQFLSWERVLLDIHSGRIFGKFGVLAADIIALLLIMLSVSGLYIWLRYANHKR